MAERHLVIRITTDARAAAQRRRLMAEISAAIAEFEREDADLDSGDQTSTIIDWSWTEEAT